MSIPSNVAPAVEQRPAVQPIPLETLPNNPDDPCGVRPEIIEEIEEIGRKHAGSR